MTTATCSTCVFWKPDGGAAHVPDGGACDLPAAGSCRARPPVRRIADHRDAPGVRNAVWARTWESEWCRLHRPVRSAQPPADHGPSMVQCQFDDPDVIPKIVEAIDRLDSRLRELEAPL